MGTAFNVNRRAALSAVAFGLLGPRPALADPTGTRRPPAVEDALPELDRIVADAMRRTGVPGLAVAVVRADLIIYLKGFGVRMVGSADTVDADTIFPLASVSKPLATTVVAGLVGDGLVGWDDPITKHLPGFEMFDPWVTRAVTLRDLFAHRSGLPDHAGDPLEDLGYDRADILHRLRYQKPGSSFRSHYDYTNFGFTAAGVAAAAASGRSWEDLCVERLYSRLGMARTSSRFADFAAASNRVHSHVRENGAWVAKYTREPDAQAPAGGVTSSMRDVAAWLCLQLGQGTVEGQEIVQAAALAETHRPQIVSNRTKDPAVDRDGFYGLGWNVNYDERDGIRWSHSGAFNLGAATCVEVLPNQKLAIGVLSNAQPIGVPEAIIQSFVDVIMTGQVQRDWISFLGDIFKRLMGPDYGTTTDYANLPPQATPPLAPRAYAGAYENDLFGRIVVAPTAQGMELRLGPKPLSFPLRHFDRDTFLYQPVGEGAFGPSSVAFLIGADGKPVSVTIKNLNLNGQGTFAFAPAKG